MPLLPFAKRRKIVCVRKARAKLIADGWEEVSESGGMLGELTRGGRMGHVITEVAIDPGGKSLWIKTSNEAA